MPYCTRVMQEGNPLHKVAWMSIELPDGQTSQTPPARRVVARVLARGRYWQQRHAGGAAARQALRGLVVRRGW